MNTDELTRYEKQIALPEMGIEGQKRLCEGRVLVVGAGGLGCPALVQLASAGVGTLGIVDGDRVELSNLPRQTLFKVENLGQNKAEVAASQLKEMNEHIRVEAYPKFLNEENVEELLEPYDIILDATDQPAPRYAISKMCEELGKVHIYGAVEGMIGQIAVFNVLGKKRETYSYQDLFKEACPDACQCSSGGILGMVPSSIGVLQALEAIKLLLGQRSPLQSHLLRTDLKNYEHTLVSLHPKDCSGRGFCLKPLQQHISFEELKQLLQSPNPPTLVDVRNKSEPQEGHIGGLWIPLDSLEEEADCIPTDRMIVLYCRSGRRSGMAASILKAIFPDADIRCLKQQP